MRLDSSSFERLVPDDLRPDDVTGSETLALHLERYRFAAAHMRPGRVLDIACGTGYGTRFLVDHVLDEVSVIGVDISEAAVAYATQRYGSERIRFLVADAMSFRDLAPFDTIVSLETVEHLSEPNQFIARLRSQLSSPGGTLIVSVPTTPSVDVNPYHLTDFTEASVRAMISRYRLREVGCLRQVQPYRVVSLLTKREARAKDLRSNLPLYYLAHPRSFARRIASTLRYGFTNRYITIAWRADS